MSYDSFGHNFEGFPIATMCVGYLLVDDSNWPMLNDMMLMILNWQTNGAAMILMLKRHHLSPMNTFWSAIAADVVVAFVDTDVYMLHRLLLLQLL